MKIEKEELEKVQKQTRFTIKQTQMSLACLRSRIFAAVSSEGVKCLFSSFMCNPIWRRPLFLGFAWHQENQPSSSENEVTDHRKLFIRNLKFKTKKYDLEEYFSSFGDIEEVELPVTKVTGRSKGFAFVTFQDESAAKRALNHPHTFEGRELTLAYATDNPPPAQCRTNVICVKNVTPEIDREQIMEHFSNFGAVLAVDLPVDPTTNKRHPYCFVHFTYEEEAEEAVKNRIQALGNCSVEIRKSLARMSPTFTDKIVVYPPEDSTVNSIRNYFENFGTVLSVVLNFVLVGDNPQPRLVARVLFDNSNTVNNVMNQAHVVKGHPVVVIRGDQTSKFQDTADRRIFIDGLPSWVTERDIKKYFSQFGFVTLCHYLQDPKTGGKLNWCLLAFNSPTGVHKTMRINEHQIGGETVRVRRKGWQSERISSLMKHKTDFHY